MPVTVSAADIFLTWYGSFKKFRFILAAHPEVSMNTITDKTVTLLIFMDKFLWDKKIQWLQ